ncbi:MAG: hypothetical protein ACOX9A_15405 [Anaerolineae bacterium]|jgi:hypothetical protein
MWPAGDYRCCARSLFPSPSAIAVLVIIAVATLTHRVGQGTGRPWIEWLRRHISAIVTAAVGLALTGMLANFFTVRESAAINETFHSLAITRSAAFADALHNIHAIYLEGLARFFESSEYVDREEFRTYVDLMDNPAVRAWGWIPITPADALTGPEQSIPGTDLEGTPCGSGMRKPDNG